MKATVNFTKVISAYIEREKDADELFAKCVEEQPNKTIDGCVNYILKTVKDSGIAGWTDEEIFGMARVNWQGASSSILIKISVRQSLCISAARC